EQRVPVQYFFSRTKTLGVVRFCNYNASRIGRQVARALRAREESNAVHLYCSSVRFLGGKDYPPAQEWSMKAWVLHGVRDLRREDRPEPVASAGYVVIRVARAGICGS